MQMKKYLAIFSLLFILTGCGDSNDPVEIESFEDQELMTYQEQLEEEIKELKEAEAEVWKKIDDSKLHPIKIAYERMNAMPQYCHQTQADMNICSYELSNRIDKEITELTKDSEVFSLEHFQQFAREAIDQEYPCQDPVAETSEKETSDTHIQHKDGGIWIPIKECGLHSCDEANDVEPPDDRVFDDEGNCLRQIHYGTIQSLNNNMLYISKGEEYKRMLIHSSLKDAMPSDSSVWAAIVGDCIYEISLHVPTKACIAQMEADGGVWFNDSIMVFENRSPPPYSGFEAIDITKAYTDEVYYTGELTFTDDNNKRDVLYLIYGHDFSHRVMSYENGKLNGLSSYVDQGGNPVLLEWYDDGVLTSQSSAVHEAKDRGRNYSDLCKPAGDPGGWRSCGHIKFSEQ